MVLTSVKIVSATLTLAVNENAFQIRTALLSTGVHSRDADGDWITLFNLLDGSNVRTVSVE